MKLIRKIRQNIIEMPGNLYFNLFVSTFLIIVVCVYLLGFFSYSISSNIIERNSNNYNQKIIHSINNKLDSYFDKLLTLTSIVYSKDIQTLLVDMDNSRNRKAYNISHNKLLSRFCSWAELLKLNQIIISGLFVIDPSGHLLSQSTGNIDEEFDFSELNIFKNAIASSGKAVFTVINREDYKIYSNSVQGAKKLIVSRKINSIDGGNCLGVVVLAIPWDYIEKVITEITQKESAYYYILDNANNLIFSSGKDIEISTIMQAVSENNHSTVLKTSKSNYLINTSVSSYSRWTFVSVVPTIEIYNDINYIKKISYLLIAASFFLALIISVFFARSISNPLSKLKLFAANIENGIFDNAIELNSYHEFNLLANTFNQMTQRLKESISKNYILTLKERESQLTALQSQINPHFLYNTLNSINTYAQLNGVDEISDMIYALSDILRYSLQKNRDFVRIIEEIEHIKNYLFIQNIRYNNEIEVIFNVDEKIYNYKMIHFILQPLIENAIIHGLELKEGDRKIRITGYKNDNIINFRIEDNGIGIADEKLLELEKCLEDPQNILLHNDNRTRIGVLNVNQRIKLTFGDIYGLGIESRENEGTTITITFPAITDI